MKTPIRIAVLAAALCLPVLGETAAELMAKAKKAESDGDVNAARAAYTTILQADPGNANARYMLGQLNTNAVSISANARVKQMSDIKIPEINFENVTFKEALDALSVMTEKASGEKKFSPNFMIRDPSNKLGDQPLTLKLKGVPAKVILDKMLELVGASAKYDQYAVVISPLSAK